MKPATSSARGKQSFIAVTVLWPCALLIFLVGDKTTHCCSRWLPRDVSITHCRMLLHCCGLWHVQLWEFNNYVPRNIHGSPMLLGCLGNWPASPVSKMAREGVCQGFLLAAVASESGEWILQMVMGICTMSDFSLGRGLEVRGLDWLHWNAHPLKSCVVLGCHCVGMPFKRNGRLLYRKCTFFPVFLGTLETIDWQDLILPVYLYVNVVQTFSLCIGKAAIFTPTLYSFLRILKCYMMLLFYCSYWSTKGK